jgi:L-cystine uptake protein TcyP (sodium:dicarboxylate symporter family)
MESLRRSAFLTTGQRGAIFGAVLVLGVLNFGVSLAANLVPVAGPVLDAVGTLVTLGLSATTCAVIYYRLRSFHESIDVDQIASVFA